MYSDFATSHIEEGKIIISKININLIITGTSSVQL